MPEPNFLQLRDYFLKELHIRCLGAAPTQPPSSLSFQFESQPLPEAPDAVEFSMKVALKPEAARKEPSAGYDLEVVIAGIFAVPEGVPEDLARDMLEINGSMILYGLLRGLLASATGMFPTQHRFLLPTVNFAHIVEQRRAKEKEARSPKRKPAAKRKPSAKRKPAAKR